MSVGMRARRPLPIAPGLSQARSGIIKICRLEPRDAPLWLGGATAGLFVLSARVGENTFLFNVHPYLWLGLVRLAFCLGYLWLTV